MPITALVGEQRGDEGKGRFTDMVAAGHDIVAKFNGGFNAGHTVNLPDGRVLALHLLPSGVAHDHTVNVIGNGTVVEPRKLKEELADAAQKGIAIDEGRLMISSAAHLILPHHISADEVREAGSAAQGSTKSGIAPVYADKAMRSGIRMEAVNNDIDGLEKRLKNGLEEANEQRADVGLAPIEISRTSDEYLEAAMELGSFVTDTVLYLNRRLRDGARVLAEGAQAFLLDLDHGMYDAVTSSTTTTGGIFTGLGVPYYYLDRVIGVAKAVPSHVGGGPFTTEIHDEADVSRLHGAMDQIDSEVGTTTGRTRRLGYLDLPAIKRAQMINGTTEMALTKLDWVPRYGEKIRICTSYTRKGRELEVSPDAAYKLKQSTPNYIELDAWKEDVSSVRRFGDLPPEAQRYIEFIESETEVPITMIGVGPRRDQVILRD